MNYERIYKDLVSSSYEHCGYTELHHIVPRHAGGLDDHTNLVKLSYKAHKLAHRLLYKIYGRTGDLLAYRLMNVTENRRRSNIIEAARLGGEIGCKNPATVASLSKLRADSAHQSKAGKIGGVRSGESRRINPVKRPDKTLSNTGKAWWTNGTINNFSVECPSGFRKGRVQKPYKPRKC